MFCDKKIPSYHVLVAVIPVPSFMTVHDTVIISPKKSDRIIFDNTMYICNSYYMLSVPYCVYCTRPWVLRTLGSRAVNKAIQQGERVVSGLYRKIAA